MGKAQFASVRESPKGMRLLKWLRRKPQPFKVIGEQDDGDEITCALGTGKSMRPWTDAVRVLIECVKVTALNEAGETIRVMEFDEENDPTLIAENERAESRGAPPAGSVPLISLDVPKLVDNIARNIREAVAETAGQQTRAYDAGFKAMVSVVNLALGLLVRLDQRLEVVQESADANANVNALPPGDNRDQLVLMALQKALGQQQPDGGASVGGINISPQHMSALAELYRQMSGNGAAAQPNGASHGG
jgi:hypothetical protein